MWMLIAFVGVGIFLFGLMQWARTGSSLWQIIKLRRAARSGELSLEQHREAEHEVARLERSADRTLRTSIKVIGWLAILVWLFLGASFVMESLGVSLIGELSSRAVSYWSSTSSTGRNDAKSNQNTILRGLGNNLRK